MLTRINTARTQSTGVVLYVLEDTQNLPVIRGNKHYKLRDNLAAASEQGHQQVLSFGGAYSNHIHALAWAAREQGLRSIGIIRGSQNYAGNPTLTDAEQWGMQLEFVSRGEYRRRYDQPWLDELQQRFPSALLIPEGGGNLRAVKACKQMLDELSAQLMQGLDVLACALGTGATACGLSLALHSEQTVRAYSVVPDEGRAERMRMWLSDLPHNNPRWEEIPVTLPKYGKLDSQLCQFIDQFFLQTNVLLDPLYTGKMLQGVMHDIASGAIAPGSTVVAIHTGGIQGWRGFLPKCESWLSATTLAAVYQSFAYTV